MNEKTDRKHIVVGQAKEIEKADKEYWAKATVEEKLRTITYLVSVHKVTIKPHPPKYRDLQPASS